MSYNPQQQVPPQQGYSPQQQPPAPYTQGPPPAPAGGSFDFAAFWKTLGLTGQVVSIAGLVLLIAFFLDWYSVSSVNTGFGTYPGQGYTGSTAAGDAGGIAFLMWLVPLGAIAMAGAAIMGVLGKLQAKQVGYGILGGVGGALLGEIAFLIRSSELTGGFTSDQLKTLGISAGPAFGFYLAVLATLAAGGVYVYFNYIKKPAPRYPGQ